MFRSFFPQPKLLFSTMAIWALFCVLVWFYLFQDFGANLSFGNFLGFAFPDAVSGEATSEILAAYKSTFDSAVTFWLYQYFLVAMALFCGAWMLYSPHPWQKWSVLGSALIFFANWFLVQLDVMINVWYGEFFDLIQKALAESGAVTPMELYLKIAEFLQIALIYVTVAVIFRFFVSHFIFRWRTAMNEYFTANWKKLRHIEGASQRVQDDTMRFASIMEGLGVSFLDSIMVLIAFLPVLWKLSEQITVLPIIGEVSQGLVFVAIIWSIFGTALLALVGVKLPGLQFKNQKVEAAYRKELVLGEDHTDRATPQSLSELFADVRKNYFRLYFHYMYFNVVRIFYLQFGSLIPYVALVPTIAAGAVTLGVMQRIIQAFNKVENSFQFLINSWTTIVELMSIFKRLQAFEVVLKDQPLPHVDGKTEAT